MSKNSKVKSTDFKSGTEDFKERLRLELDKMKVDPIKKDIILELIDIELKHPTTDKDATDRYLNLLEEKDIA